VPEIVVAIPCYNERDNIARLVPDVLKIDERLHVIVIDDNSPDGTGEVADSLAAAGSRVQVIHRPGKLGLGTAYRDAMKTLLATDCRLFITMDADYSHHPRHVPTMLDLAKRFDVVIGSRYVSGGGITEWSTSRKMMSRLAGSAARVCLGLPGIADPMGGFRCYNFDIVRKFDPRSIVSTGFSFQAEMLYRFRRAGATMVEFPIVFENRTRGESKIYLGEATGLLKTIIRLRLGKRR